MMEIMLIVFWTAFAKGNFFQMLNWICKEKEAKNWLLGLFQCSVEESWLCRRIQKYVAAWVLWLNNMHVYNAL